jgi:3-hydroxyisobutyrate dehydrogenase-like beta-hydroxyacid dehydrogenase
LGLLGAKVAERLVNEKFPVAVWNRSIDKAKDLGEKGAKVRIKSRPLLFIVSSAGSSKAFCVW